MEHIISFINQNASEIKEEDIDSIIPDVLDHLDSKIRNIFFREKDALELDDLSYKYVRKISEDVIRSALNTYLFKLEHWRDRKNIAPYLISCLNNLKRNLDLKDKFSKSVPVCPGCKTLNSREFVHKSGRLLTCHACSIESDRLGALAKRTSREEYEYRIRRIFTSYSRKGRRCPACSRFVPESLLKASESIRVSCPYDNCDWFGIQSEMESMDHPVTKSTGTMVYMDGLEPAHNTKSTGNSFITRSNDANADIIIEQKQKTSKELEIVKEVLRTQKERILGKLPNKPGIIDKHRKKYLMYQAFEALLEEDVIGMLNYLTVSDDKKNRNQALGDRPIQSLIFQKYISIIEGLLPFNIIVDGEQKEVYSLLDSDLSLFIGQSEFYSYVKESGIVSNNTHEVFVGTKCNGPCFIGLLCNIFDDQGKSLLSEVEYYTFSFIRMKQTIPQGTPVKVIHYRIPPHYEMYSLVNLQRIRRKIVDSVYKRLYGEDRPLKGKKANDTSKIISEVSHR